MTPRSGSGRSSEASPDTGPPAKPKPNRNTIATRPHKHVERTKAEMYEDLRKAVENTK
jgi:hypothetical protein